MLLNRSDAVPNIAFPLLKSATAMSGLPSKFKSPSAKPTGPKPTAKVFWAANVAVMLPAGVVFSNTDTEAFP